MTLESNRLKTSLNEAIGKWLDVVCGSGEFNDSLPERTVQLDALMTEAAFAVLNANRDCYTYLQDEGLLKEE